ncbi:MAG: alpha-amylase family glycosyl hydrolase, partial [Opitutaceae bacterium]
MDVYRFRWWWRAARGAWCAWAGAAGLLAQEPRQVALPAWRHPAAEGVMYFVVTDRFQDGDSTNNTGGASGPRDVTGWDPSSRFHYHGGDLRGLTQRLDYLQTLGITSVWLTPVMKNKPLQGTTASYHGYWITDFLSVDPHLGTAEDLHALVRAAGQRGMRVILDIVVNHSADVITGGAGYRSRALYPYRDASGQPFDERALAYNGLGPPSAFPALQAGVSFPYIPVVSAAEAGVKNPAWLNDLRFYHHRGNASYTGEDFLMGDISGLDDLFTERPEVVLGFIDLYTHWLTTFDIGGYRIDTTKHVNAELWQAFAPRMREAARAAGRPDFLQFGEVLSGDSSFLSEWSTAAGLDATLDFAFAYAVRDFVSRARSGSGLVALWEADDAYTDFDSNVHATQTFLSNHDIGRFGSFLRQDNPFATDAQLVGLMTLAHALLMFSRGQPVVYYGDEQGLAGPGGDAEARQDMGASQTLQYFNETLIGTTRTGADSKFEPGHPLYRAVAEMAALRRNHAALARGAQRTRSTGTGGVVAFSRIERTEQIEYVATFNQARSGRVTVTIPTSQPAGATLSPLYDSSGASGGAALVADGAGQITVTLDPLQARVWRADRPLSASPVPLGISIELPGSTGELVFSPPRTVEGSTFAGRAEIRAGVTGAPAFAEVTFAFQRSSRPGQWEIIGTDDAPPYRVYFRPPADLSLDEPIALLATVDDGRGRRSMARRDGVRLAQGASVRFGVTGSIAPHFGSMPGARRGVSGTAVTLEAAVEGTPPLVYQWRKDGVALAGATGVRLSIPVLQSADAGSYDVVASNRAGATLGPPVELRVMPAGEADRFGRLVNLAVRTQVGVGAERLITGFVTSLPGKAVVIRAVGPTLGGFGVEGVLADPRLELFQGQTRVAGNDDWTADPSLSLGAFALPVGSKDAVLASTLDGAGYTAQASGAGETTGIAL